MTGDLVPALDEVRRAAAGFLLAARDARGWWSDFRLAPGESDEWVTAYVAGVLAESADPACLEAARLGWALLCTRRHRRGGLWGYNALTPGDADSTAWALRLARRLGFDHAPRARQTLDSLKAFQGPEGGVAAYARDAEIRAFIGAPPERDFSGWCGPQACVTAAAAELAPMAPAALLWLRARASGRGDWTAYWWRDHDYTRHLAATAFARAGRPSDADHVAAARAAARSRLSAGPIVTAEAPEGSAFATACALSTLSLGPLTRGDVTIMAQATRWLIGRQGGDGGFAASARLVVPDPDEREPWRRQDWLPGGLIEGAMVLDHRRVYTTATVLDALQRVADGGSVAAAPGARRHANV